MAAGVKPTSANNKKVTLSQSLYVIVETLCDRFKLDPFNVYSKYLDEVLDIWTGAVISANSGANKNKNEEDNKIWVNSKTATWH